MNFSVTNQITMLKKKPFNRKEATAKVLDHHKNKFKELSINDPLFIPKCAYKPYGTDELHISFFPSEIEREQDIYVEFCSKECEPETRERILYKWRHNPHYKEEYEHTEPNDRGHVRYLIPVSELINQDNLIEQDKKEEEIKKAFPNFESEFIDPDTDNPINQMTIRDLASILWKKPVSNKKWLNNLIKDL